MKDGCIDLDEILRNGRKGKRTFNMNAQEDIEIGNLSKIQSGKGVTMFEKEAEEYTLNKLVGLEDFDNYQSAYDRYENGVQDAFKDGAEFGYNKANEWHYVKDEKDLPTDKKEYLLLLGSSIRTFGFYNGRFWESWKGDFSWQEVKAYFFVPVPELKESE